MAHGERERRRKTKRAITKGVCLGLQYQKKSCNASFNVHATSKMGSFEMFFFFLIMLSFPVMKMTHLKPTAFNQTIKIEFFL